MAIKHDDNGPFVRVARSGGDERMKQTEIVYAVKITRAGSPDEFWNVMPEFDPSELGPIIRMARRTHNDPTLTGVLVQRTVSVSAGKWDLVDDESQN